MKKTSLSDSYERKENGLLIAVNAEKPLSKNQQLFNKLTQRIETLEKNIAQEEERLNQLLNIHSKEIIPLQKKIGNTRIQLAMALEKAAEVNKFSKKQSEQIRETIQGLCEDAFADIEPSPEQEAFYDKWSDVPHHEELEQIKNETKEMFTGFMSEMFGMDVDMSDFEDNSEGFDRFQQKVIEQFDKGQEYQFQQNHKKTKKQQALEEEKKKADDIKNKSIRSVYLALAKVLHPDTELDIHLKSEKEEILKKVTVAYDQKDLVTLLKLEMEWVHKTSEHLEKLSDEKLMVYISALKQQAAELEREKLNLRYHPRYSNISHYNSSARNSSLNQIRHNMRELENESKELNNLIKTFGKPNAKKEITAFINEYSEQDDLLDYYF